MTTTSIQFSLDRGERQLWAGVPRQGVVLRPSDALTIPFSLFWTGGVTAGAIAAIHSGERFFMLWMVPFVAVGFYMVIARFWVDAWRRSRTTYAITTDRVIINGGLLAGTSKSLLLRTLSDVALEERPDGTGTITFGAPTLSRRRDISGVPQIPAFEMIPDARRVYSIIRDAQRGAPSDAAPAGGSDAVRYTPLAAGGAAPFQGAQVGKQLKRIVTVVFVVLGLFYLGSRNKKGDTDPTKTHVLTSAEIDSLRRLPTIVDTIIARRTLVELKVGDSLWLSDLLAETRDSTGHVLHDVPVAYNIPRTEILKSAGPALKAVAPGHATVFIEDRPRNDSIPRRPSTRIDVDVRP